MLDPGPNGGMPALLSRFTQDTRRIRLTTALGSDLLAECVRGDEAISQGYAFDIDALSTVEFTRPGVSKHDTGLMPEALPSEHAFRRATTNLKLAVHAQHAVLTTIFDEEHPHEPIRFPETA